MAKSDVGTITVYLEARSQAFDAGIKKATSSIGKLEGRLKQTGMAFTEFQSKIGVTVAAVEVLAKASDAAARAMKGDFDGVVETMRQLPMGLGTAFGAMYDLSTRHIWGHADEIAASKEQIKKLEEKQAQLTKLTAADEARVQARALQTESSSSSRQLFEDFVDALDGARRAAWREIVRRDRSAALAVWKRLREKRLEEALLPADLRGKVSYPFDREWEPYERLDEILGSVEDFFTRRVGERPVILWFRHQEEPARDRHAVRAEAEGYELRRPDGTWEDFSPLVDLAVEDLLAIGEGDRLESSEPAATSFPVVGRVLVLQFLPNFLEKEIQEEYYQHL